MTMILIGGTGRIGSKTAPRLAAEPDAGFPSDRTIDRHDRRPAP